MTAAAGAALEWKNASIYDVRKMLGYPDVPSVVKIRHNEEFFNTSRLGADILYGNPEGK